MRGKFFFIEEELELISAEEVKKNWNITILQTSYEESD